MKVFQAGIFQHRDHTTGKRVYTDLPQRIKSYLPCMQHARTGHHGG